MLLDDIYTYLSGFTPWTTGGVTYSLGKFFQPDTPDTTISLIEFAGGKPVRAMGTSLGSPVKERAGLQVLVRSPIEDYGNGRAIAEAVHLKLDFLNTTLSGRAYFVEALHAPILLEQDRSKRWLISTNYIVLKDRG